MSTETISVESVQKCMDLMKPILDSAKDPAPGDHSFSSIARSVPQMYEAMMELFGGKTIIKPKEGETQEEAEAAHKEKALEASETITGICNLLGALEKMGKSHQDQPEST